MARLYVYKNNARDRGDWAVFFDDPDTGYWGTDRMAGEMEPGDLVVAYQSDRREAIGLATFLGTGLPGDEDDLMYFRPLRRFDPPLLLSALRQCAPSAFRQGYVRTIYPLPSDEQRRLLDMCLSAPAIDCTTSSQHDASADWNQDGSELAVTAALLLARVHLLAEGWSVHAASPTSDGYDYQCVRGESTRCICVASLGGGCSSLYLSDTQHDYLTTSRLAALLVVRGALGTSPTFELLEHEQIVRRFVFTPTEYCARERSDAEPLNASSA